MANAFLLLVEGKDDEHVLYHLLKHYKVPEQFRIKNKNGIENLLETLDVEIIGSGLKRLGIIVDADADLQNRWQSLRHVLMQSGYLNVPAAPVADGIVLEQARLPVFGIWLMPDNQRPGMLEDFVSLLVPESDVLWPLAIGSVEQAAAIDRRFPEGHQVKAIIHTWLAWQRAPGTPFGSAINERFLSADASPALALINWIRRLFSLPA